MEFWFELKTDLLRSAGQIAPYFALFQTHLPIEYKSDHPLCQPNKKEAQLGSGYASVGREVG